MLVARDYASAAAAMYGALDALAKERAAAPQWPLAVLRRLPPFIREPRSVSHWGMVG